MWTSRASSPANCVARPERARPPEGAPASGRRWHLRHAPDRILTVRAIVEPELHGGGAEDWLRIALPICSRFVCEGIAPHLPPDALTGLLARLGERAAVRRAPAGVFALLPRGMQ